MMRIENDYRIVERQFLGLQELYKDIEIINIVSEYTAKAYSIGINTEHFKYHNYKELFDKTLGEERFTLSLLDDSMIVLYYEFNEEGKIIKHNLSFLPNYRYDLFRCDKMYDDEDEGEDEISSEVFAERINNYIRIDFDDKGYEEYYHAAVHMHIGVFQGGIRIPVQTIIYPYEFLYLIFKYLYHIGDCDLEKLNCEHKKDLNLSVRELKKFRLVYGAIENV